MIGVAENDTGVGLAHHVERQRLDGGGGADGHEDRCRDIAAGRLQHAGARLALVGVDFEGEAAHFGASLAARLRFVQKKDKIAPRMDTDRRCAATRIFGLSCACREAAFKKTVIRRCTRTDTDFRVAPTASAY